VAVDDFLSGLRGERVAVRSITNNLAWNNDVSFIGSCAYVCSHPEEKHNLYSEEKVATYHISYAALYYPIQTFLFGLAINTKDL
jgi:hypothetical protein